MRTALTFFSVCISVASASLVHAQCECDHEVGLDVRELDGAAFEPGDRVCILAGEREFLRISNLAGTDEAPITILNCGGLVRIHNEDRAYALVVEGGSHHFHLTGTGDPSLTYGFEISAPDREPYPGVGLWLLGRSTNYEVDHLEIHDTGFAGVSAKTDPTCDGLADADRFTQRDAWLHHLYVHDTGGEGFYVGSTQANGQTIRCDGAEEVHMPHFLEGIRVTDNLVEDTGWDGMQVGMARSDCLVARNVIRRVGLEGVEFQQQGIQIGSFSACEVASNVVMDGPASGLFLVEAAESWVHDNLVVGFDDADAIYANVRDRSPGARYRFHFNTVVGYERNGITVFGGILGPSEAIGNLVVGTGDGIGAGGDVEWTASHNVVVATVGEAGFVGADDYHLLEGSPARGAGQAVEGLDRDLEGYPRADPPSAGAFEYRVPGVDAGPIATVDAGTARRDAGTPSGSDGGATAEPSDGGGCGCASTNASGAWSSLALVAMFGRRRRR
ncbi:MAG: hypothetical protein H6721_11450 [Sandaracinus sp.]|nr:hypothetical protein [Sandaracinus sp.]MCB9619156.1 hypothetical protein [Sandaracinus sp.]MCB9632738.1 hypothetical protein [Sandaracinus sp.]